MRDGQAFGSRWNEKESSRIETELLASSADDFRDSTLRFNVHTDDDSPSAASLYFHSLCALECVRHPSDIP